MRHLFQTFRMKQLFKKLIHINQQVKEKIHCCKFDWLSLNKIIGFPIIYHVLGTFVRKVNAPVVNAVSHHQQQIEQIVSKSKTPAEVFRDSRVVYMYTIGLDKDRGTLRELTVDELSDADRLPEGEYV